MKKLTFTVTIEFADKITDDNEINEVGKNIAYAIKNSVDNMGIVPEASETFTEQITVEKDGEEIISLKAF